ncbi:GPI inositol-deacylase isoform X1 [Microcaecilia unicolor]|uniref:GPI inositol-deacylase n=1 Tax=Microcaecilia unicolor TaxID=1415580 RepID=A0A6P7YPH9_9AMPH|nr:GPI inositol-deacylase isoform X1 [Microcaecilia unicolor]
MRPVSAVCWGTLLCLVLLGAWDLFRGNEENRCSMTYMFEYPEYLKIKLPKRISRRYPSYELYLYGEGVYAKENAKLELTGIPILFLPGNAGSYKQVRSLGSIALRKAENIDLRFNFNFFSISFNEELVALYGGSLRKQTKFVYECVKAILQLYKGQDFAPHNVAIIGHSMGGLVARALFALKNFNPDLINLIITQATPHVAPVLPVDRFLIDFYTNVNNYWILKSKELRNVTILSVAGGFRDYQVRSGLAFLPRSNSQHSALSVLSSSVPRCWASTDHLSIVWCKELILATIRAFFDLIDEDTKQISEDPERRMAVLNHHFVRHPAKYFEEKDDTVITLSGSSIWIPVQTLKWTYTVNKESNETFFTFLLSSFRKNYSHFHCQSNFMYTNSWIYGCKNNGSFKCLEVDDLSWKTELLPTVKVVTLKLEDYSSFSHVVVHVPTTNGTKFTIDCEFFNEDSRTVHVPVTHLLSFGLYSSKVKLNSSGLVHNVQLQHFNQIYQAFNILIERHCQSVKERKLSVYRLRVPWSLEDSTVISSDAVSTGIPAKLHVAQSVNDSSVVTLILYSSQDCQFEISVKTSFMQILGQVIRFHGPSLPVFIVSNILLAYGGQLKALISEGHCIKYDLALERTARPYKIEPIINICKFLLGFNWFRSFWNVLLLPELDTIIQTSQGVWFPLASLFLLVCGTGIAYWFGILFSALLRLFSSLWIALKRSCVLPEDNKILTLRRLCLCVLLVILSMMTCGAFALLLVYLHYLFKVIKLYSAVRQSRSSFNLVAKAGEMLNHSKKETIENCGSANISAAGEGQHLSSSCNLPSHSDMDNAVDNLNMHITIMNLLTWIILLSSPSLIYWLKNLRYSIQLDPDPCGPVAIILIFALEMIMNSSITSVKSSILLKTASRLQLLLAIATVAFGTMHLYRALYFVTLSLFFHVLCCFV